MPLSTRCKVAFAHLIAVVSATLNPLQDLRAAAPLAGSSSVQHLKRLSLEDLLNIDVISVSRRSEPFGTTASAISVLTGDDVRRSGATTLADALRFSTGLEVARIDGRTWGIASRGFNINSSNKLQVMMDGRSLYTPLFSGVFWDVQDTELADLDRIEVVRGPGATMWGANAVNGVISIQTKSAQDTQGTLISAGVGNEERQFSSFRHGLRLANGVFARVYVKQFHRDDMVLPNGVDANDDGKMWQGGFRADGEHSRSLFRWTLQGDLYDGLLGSTTAVESRVAGGNFIARGRYHLSPERAATAQLYYDRVERVVPGQFRETRDTFDLDTQFDTRLGGHDLTLGLTGRTSADRTGTMGTVQFEPPNRRMWTVSALIQDEIRFDANRVALNLGAKFEENSSTGLEVQPSLRATWTPDPKHTIWGAVSRATRTPTRFDDDLRFLTFIRGDPDFRAEELTAFEIGYRVQPHRDWSLDLNLFSNRYDHLRSQERANETDALFVLRNRLNAKSAGGEVAIRAQLAPGWRVRAMYAHLHKRLHFDPDSTDITGGSQEGNDPEHLATFVSSWDLLPGWEFDALVRHVGALPQPHVPRYTELDLRLSWRPSTTWEFSITGQNLLDKHHREFGAPAPNGRELERSYYAKVTWQY